MKNPTFEICSDAAIEYLKNGTDVGETIRSCIDIRRFVAIRTVKGGAIQFDHMIEVDDWFEVEKGLWSHEGRTTKPVKRVSRPKPRKVGVGGTNVGRVARWYMSSASPCPISYALSGNKVPDTDGAMLCMTLPDEMPSDVDYEWYERRTMNILNDIGALRDVTSGVSV